MRLGGHATLVVAIVLCACGGGDATSPPDPARRGIQFISGNNVTDTAGAVLSQALVIEVRDSSGALAPQGTVVRFTSVPNASSTAVEAEVQSLTSQAFETFVTGTTDASGRTGIRVRLGVVAGPARIGISAPTRNVGDTARYTIVAGAAARLAVLPSDTGLYVGRTYSLRSRVTDQHGNARSDPLTWTTSGAGTSVSNAGVVSATAIGRYALTASAGTLTANVGVTVVPEGRIAAWRIDSTSRIVAVDLDGSNLRDLTSVNGSASGAHPAWIPGTNAIIYSHYNGVVQALYRVEESGTVTPFFSSPPPNMSHQAEPTFSANGQWLFFTGYDLRCGDQVYCVYRARIDGTSLEHLDTRVQQGSVSWKPAPSPDGTKVAFVTTLLPAAREALRVFDLQTRTLSSWSVLGQTPRWSPTGSQIAFVQLNGGPIMLLNPDGSGERRLTAFGRVYGEQPLGWSPDSRWLVARSVPGLDLIDAMTGAVLPIDYLGRLSAASFK